MRSNSLHFFRSTVVIFTGLVWMVSTAAGAQNSRVRPQHTPTRPNILLIITDDQGYGDLGVHGNPKLRTPNLDRLARESVAFQSFYVSPVCAPTRASLLQVAITTVLALWIPTWDVR